jgi:Raf kinase inhibitor-like YbhB/YbcL family protein
MNHNNHLNFTILNFTKKNSLCEKHGGLNLAPSINWSSINKAKSYILILFDPDAPSGTFIHWYIPFISSNITSINLSQNIMSNKIVTNITNNDINILDKINYNNFINKNKIKLIQGFNSLNEIGYHGPCAPESTGTHRYIFKFYAIDNILPNINNHLKIKNDKELENILNSYNINILDIFTKTFIYKYGDKYPQIFNN